MFFILLSFSIIILMQSAITHNYTDRSAVSLYPFLHSSHSLFAEHHPPSLSEPSHSEKCVNKWIYINILIEFLLSRKKKEEGRVLALAPVVLVRLLEPSGQGKQARTSKPEQLLPPLKNRTEFWQDTTEITKCQPNSSSPVSSTGIPLIPPSLSTYSKQKNT